MELARHRALTRITIYSRISIYFSRNGVSPPQGIDTHLSEASLPFLELVEMKLARHRALTQTTIIYIPGSL